jgi:hypothetical protein
MSEKENADDLKESFRGPPSTFIRTQEERDWVQRVIEGTKRMETDEAFRKEIAKDLS